MTNAVTEYRVLWFDLAKLTRETGLSICYTYGFYILYMFMKLTLYVYRTLSALLFVPKRMFVMVYSIFSVLIDVAIMFTFCDIAQLAQRKVKTKNVFLNLLKGLFHIISKFMVILF